MKNSAHRILVTGANGYLASCFLKMDCLKQSALLLAVRKGSEGGAYEQISTEGGISSSALVKIEEFAPTHIFHFAALSSPGECEMNPERAKFSNLTLTEQFLHVAERISAKFIFASTDLVFEGSPALFGGYRENDAVSPCSHYGKLKAEAERCVLESGCSSVVARLSLLIGGSHGAHAGPLGWMLRSFQENEKLTLFSDEWRTPIGVEDASRILYALGLGQAEGLYHVGGPERLNRVELGQLIAGHSGFQEGLIQSVLRSAIPLSPARAEDVSLNSDKATRCTGLRASSPAEIIRRISLDLTG